MSKSTWMGRLLSEHSKDELIGIVESLCEQLAQSRRLANHEQAVLANLRNSSRSA
jgi:hypothetical protein